MMPNDTAAERSGVHVRREVVHRTRREVGRHRVRVAGVAGVEVTADGLLHAPGLGLPVAGQHVCHSSEPRCWRPARAGDTARPRGGEIRARSEARPRYRPAMDDADGYFGERVAATYDDPSSEEFDPAVIERTADVLAGLAGPRLGSSGRALEL